MLRLLLLGFLTAASTIVMAEAATYAPLTCSDATSDAQKAVCSDYSLGQQEARTATLFGWATALVGMGQRGQIQDEQRAFIAKRESCGASRRCLNEAYTARIGQLERVLSEVAGRGPF